MYNEELKKRYLSSSIYDSKTQKTYLSDLNRIGESEDYFKKDLFNFTYEQIDEALKGIQFKKQSSVERAVSTYRMYSNWANQNGFVPSKTNLWELYTMEKLSQYVWEYALDNSFITREQLFNDIISKVENPLDYIPTLLTFEGIYGRTMDEMINLKYKDINFKTGVVKLTSNSGEQRSIILKDKRILNLIQDAEMETTYYADNGRSEGFNAKSSIIMTPFVIRKTTLKSIIKYASNDGLFYGNEKVGVMTIEARFARIFRGYRHPNPNKCKAPFVEGFSFLNATNIFKSGYFDYCLNIEKEKGELEFKDFELACVRYGIRPVLASTYKKQYLNWRNRLK
jgi:site-specific recombinase XerD